MSRTRKSINFLPDSGAIFSVAFMRCSDIKGLCGAILVLRKARVMRKMLSKFSSSRCVMKILWNRAQWP